MVMVMVMVVVMVMVMVRVSFILITTYRGPIPPFCKICGWNTIDFGHGMIIAEGHRDR